MKTIFTAIPRPAILFALALIIGSGSLAKAGEPDDLGSFDDILVALDPEPLTVTGPALTGPTVINPPAATPVHPEPTLVPLEPRSVPHNGLILNGPTINGPIETLSNASDYPSVVEPQSVIQTQTVPDQIHNPFLDFETVVEEPTQKHVAEMQYDLPSTQPAPKIIVQRETTPRIIVPATPIPSVAIKPPATIVKKTVVTTTTTFVPKRVKPECPYERARQRQLDLYPEPGYRSASRTGYVPYGGRGLDRDFGYRYRPDPYRSRSARYAPVYQGPHRSGHRYHSRSGYYGGRGISIGLRF